MRGLFFVFVFVFFLFFGERERANKKIDLFFLRNKSSVFLPSFEIKYNERAKERECGILLFS